MYKRKRNKRTEKGKERDQLCVQSNLVRVLLPFNWPGCGNSNKGLQNVNVFEDCLKHSSDVLQFINKEAEHRTSAWPVRKLNRQAVSLKSLLTSQY